MTFSKGSQLAPGKKTPCKVLFDDDIMGCKRFKTDLSAIIGDTSGLTRSRIYNIGIRKKPAELFRKDLISAMKLPDSDQLNQDEYINITDTWKEEWEKGVQVPVNPESLPDSSVVRKLHDSQVIKPPSSPLFSPPVTPVKTSASRSSSPAKEKSPAKSSSPSKKSSDKPTAPDSPLKMPVKRLKFEPERDVIASRYEIDLTDLSWLQSLKESEEAIDIREEMLEDVMNELEHQCARNMKAKHVGIEFDDQIVCDICRSPDAEEENEMVFCDSCNICVHQACYGIPVIPDGEWMCRPCQEFGAQALKKVSCIFCPTLGGAFKPTSNGKWAHVSCALWIPEVSIGCIKIMEPITKIKAIPTSRWNLVCTFCGIRQGAPIQCSSSTCKVAYHVTCAFNHHLKLKAVVDGESKGVILKSYCSKHSGDSNERLKVERSSSQADKNGVGGSNNHNKKLFMSGTHEIEIRTKGNSESDKNNRFWMYIDINEINQMLIPKFSKIYSNLSPSVIQIYIDFVLQYWKMKRTSNYGLPLIKVVTQDTIEEIQNAHRNDVLRLRVNLERIRNLSYMITRREKTKRLWLTTHRNIVQKALSLASGINLPALVCSDKSTGRSEGDMSGRTTPDDSRPNSPLASFPRLFNDYQPFVSQDEIELAQNIINSSNIYDPESVKDKLRLKRVTRELNRLSRINLLRKRLPNPYEKTWIKLRTPSISSRDGSGTGDVNHVVTSKSVVSRIKVENGPSSPHKNHLHNNKIHLSSPAKGSPGKKTPSPQNHVVNESSLLVKKSPLTPKNLKHRDYRHGHHHHPPSPASSLLLKKYSKAQQLKNKCNNNNNNHRLPHSLLKTTPSPKSSSSGRSTSVSPRKKVRKPVKSGGRIKAMNGVVNCQESFAEDPKQACVIS